MLNTVTHKFLHFEVFTCSHVIFIFLGKDFIQQQEGMNNSTLTHLPRQQ